METNQIETTELTAVDIIVAELDVQEFIVSTFDVLKVKLDAENADIEQTKLTKLTALMNEKTEMFMSDLPLETKLAKDAELTAKIIAVNNSGKMSIEHVVRNYAKYVEYDGVLYRYNNKEVHIAGAPRLSSKVSGDIHKEKWYGKQIGFRHGNQVIPLGAVEHIEAQCLQLGMRPSVYFAHVIKLADQTFDAKKGIPGWSNSNLTEIN